MSIEAMKQGRQIIWRYRHETPLGNQPYMIAHEADSTIERIDKAIAETEKQAQGEPYECVCGANLYIDANGVPRSKASIEPATVMFKQEQGEPVAWGNLANWCLDSDRVLIIDKEAAEEYHRNVYDLTPLYTTPQRKPLTTGEPVARYCCHSCFKASGGVMLDRMILCSECGNKRCPKATDHNFSCTGSNEPGQWGSIYTQQQLKQEQGEPIGTAGELFTNAALERLDFRPSTKIYTTPQQRTEQNFCSRCGKRTKDLTHIHTCTPPKENT